MYYDVVNTIKLQKSERDKILSSAYNSRNSKLDLQSGLINIIIGPRRAGKSFFGLHHLRNEKFGYLNFDDENLLRIDNYEIIIDGINQLYNEPEILFFDEIQNLKNWQVFVNKLQRRGKKIILTGSNSNLLSGELSTHLTGRNYTIHIFPFSFNELKGTEEFKTNNNLISLMTKLVDTGGYPEVVLGKIEDISYLKMLLNDTIYKDIVVRYRLREPRMIENLTNLLLSSISNEFSIKNLSKIINYNERTISKYITYLFNSMLFFQVEKFSYKVKEQIKSNKKIYCIDNGLLNLSPNSFSKNLGLKFENFVATELYKQSFKQELKIYFWKKDYEVDFVLQNKGKISQLIQVCTDLNNSKTLEREMRALIEASKELDCNNLFIITPDYTEERNFEWFGEKRKINIVSFADWIG